MPALKLIKSGRVCGLFIGDAPRRAKAPVDTLELTFAGVAGDAHGGLTRPAGVREPAFKRGTEIANLRQVSLVSAEELADIAQRMGITTIDPRWVAANIAIEGAGPITQFASGTVIRFLPSGASIYVTELNSPCSLAAKMIAKAGGYDTGVTSQFVRHATGRRGLVGTVYAEGRVARGDAVEVIFTQRELPS